MVKKNKLSVEFLLALILALIIIITLLFETFSGLIPKYFIVFLFLAYIILKLFHIIKVRGTIFEDYVSLFIILLLGILRFITINSNINIAVLVVSLFALLYSVGLIPSIKKIYNSKTIVSFLLSYAFFVIAIIILFAGTYSTNSGLFIEFGNPSNLSFYETLYFSTITFTTVGYGDIAPIGINRLISSIEAIIGIVLNIAFIGYILASKRFK